ncbi:hypothetical protein TL16_g03026 [Triparma laevis f. inornata]|uniref:Uncharacterized protein n=2 Tax=Triparma laevis TaxID=1534972 RepID=A0A9W7L1A9_9STRA|nr:hypothetical protein TL16_g03026 [Triparma laevis f. inornata]GMI18546.1 hypothetical protein TrLO_g14897 [Triparma laevis f. longispina]
MSSHKPVEGSLRSEEASSEWLSSLLGCTSSLSQHYLDFLSSSTPLLHPPKLEQDNDTLQTDLLTNDIHVNDEDRITAEIEVIKKNVLDEQGAKTPIVARPRSTSFVVPFFARRFIDLSFYRDCFVMLVERNAPLIITAKQSAIISASAVNSANLIQSSSTNTSAEVPSSVLTRSELLNLLAGLSATQVVESCRTLMDLVKRLEVCVVMREEKEGEEGEEFWGSVEEEIGGGKKRKVEAGGGLEGIGGEGKEGKEGKGRKKRKL